MLFVTLFLHFSSSIFSRKIADDFTDLLLLSKGTFGLKFHFHAFKITYAPKLTINVPIILRRHDAQHLVHIKRGKVVKGGIKILRY